MYCLRIRFQPVPTNTLDGNHLTFRIRLHPQGNKESNKDFSFFQVNISYNRFSRMMIQIHYHMQFLLKKLLNNVMKQYIFAGDQFCLLS